MSHLIVARDERQEHLALLAMGLCGPTWLSRTGFDLYAAYNAAHLNAGLSGAGDEVEVDEETAKAAHHRALRWVGSLGRNAVGGDAGKYSLERMEDVLHFTLSVARAAEAGPVAIRFA